MSGLRIWRALARFFASRRGSVAVETALTFLFVAIPLGLGAADLGTVLVTQMRLDRAVETALLAAWGNGGAVPPAALQGVINAAYGTAPPLTLSGPSFSCVCLSVSGGSETAAPATCGGGCAAGVPALYLSLTLGTTVSLPVPIPGLPSTIALSSGGTVRVQ